MRLSKHVHFWGFLCYSYDELPLTRLYFSRALFAALLAEYEVTYVRVLYVLFSSPAPAGAPTFMIRRRSQQQRSNPYNSIIDRRDAYNYDLTEIIIAARIEAIRTQRSARVPLLAVLHKTSRRTFFSRASICVCVCHFDAMCI